MRKRLNRVSLFSVITIVKASDSQDVAFSCACAPSLNRLWRKRSCLFYAVPTRITRIVSELRVIREGCVRSFKLTSKQAVIKNSKVASDCCRFRFVTFARDNSNKIFKKYTVFYNEAFSLLSASQIVALFCFSRFCAIFIPSLSFFVKKHLPLLCPKRLARLSTRPFSNARTRLLVQNNWNLL